MEITIPNKSPLELEVASTVSKVTMKIESQEGYHQAGELMKHMKTIDEKIVTTFDPIAKSIQASLDTVRQTVRDLRAPLVRGREIAAAARDEYEAEMERLRKESDRLALEAAKASAEIDIEAAEAMGLGDPGDASALAVMSMPVPPKLQKTQGISKTRHYSAELYDLRALVVAVYEGKIPLECLEGNMPVLNSLVRASKGKAVIPGVKVTWKDSTNVRR